MTTGTTNSTASPPVCSRHHILLCLYCSVCMQEYLERQVLERTAILTATLTRAQAEGTMLVLENRELVRKLTEKR